ncbi:tyrosine-type recombinase/integrase [Neobacillus pocheonensis]|uniref:Tyrosine-type recombinase/integrase n=1 Tax=Neobacillus pocheonensis TaxID=363869 RepID=A0ABT0WI25_9BACI|nr:tyrosine-type recombinase/integrase [Neobacillus pocheonensis]
MAEQSKRKGKRTVGNRLFLEEEKTNTKIMDQVKTLKDLFETFMRAKELEGLRPRTLKEHRSTFKYFLLFLEQKYPSIECAIEITTEVIRDYVYYMSKEKRLWDDHTKASRQCKTDKKGLSPFTVNIRLRTLKCLFKFLYDEGHLDHNPTVRVKLMKTEKDTIEAFSKQQILDLLRQPDQRTYAGFRDYVLMLLFLDTGIRCSEALGLTKKNFDYEQKTIKVQAGLAKNTHARILPLSKKTAKALNTLIKENGIFEDIDYIFLSNYGGKIDPSWVRSRIKTYGKQVKIDNIRVSPHTFRHTFSKFYILNGGDAFTLQRILDHATMNMVRKYVQMNGEDIKNQHHQYSPVNNLV